MSDDQNSFMFIAKALSDPARARIIQLLRQGELCVCHLIRVLDIQPTRISKHLTILKQAGLIENCRRGSYNHYHLALAAGAVTPRLAIQFVQNSLANAKECRADQARLRETLRLVPKATCSNKGKKGAFSPAVSPPINGRRPGFSIAA